MRTGGLLEWLRSCPEHDWFVEIDSGSTVGLDAAWQENGLSVPLSSERAPAARCRRGGEAPRDG
jgi:hypothetical protein